MFPLEGSWLRLGLVVRLAPYSTFGRRPVREVVGPETVGLPVALAETKPWVRCFYQIAELFAYIPSHVSNVVQAFTLVVFPLPECLDVLGDLPSRSDRKDIAKLIF